MTQLRVTIYPAGGVLTRKKWRFNIRGANNEIIATSGRQSYYNRNDLIETLKLLLWSTPVLLRDLSTGESEMFRGGA